MFASLSHRAARLALASLSLIWLAGCEEPAPSITSPTSPQVTLAPDGGAPAAMALLATTLGGPVSGLTAEEEERFEEGKVEFLAAEGVDQGLGPVFNEAACVACHDNPAGGTN